MKRAFSQQTSCTLFALALATGACSSHSSNGSSAGDGAAGVVAGAAAGSGSAGTGSAGTGSAGTGGGAAGTSAGTTGTGVAELEDFSFFVASYAAMKRLSGSEDGFGGDLTYGEADGLSGADKICSEIAETSMPGASAKGWRAFLSITKDAAGNPLHAIDRVGEGPWYDRTGRLVALTKTDLMTTRPTGADSAIANDLPNEDGVPNHAPDGTEVDNHDVLTGTNDQGQVYSSDWSVTCHDWTSKVGTDGKPRVGHSWPRSGGRGGGGGGRGSGNNWMSALDEAGCAPGASLVEMGPPNPAIPTVGSGGGYGAIYCFALQP